MFIHSESVEDLFYYNILLEIDWNFTLTFISNCNDCYERAYKVKNLLRLLPTYSLLYERETNKIESSLCIRCEEEIETWDHVWC